MKCYFHPENEAREVCTNCGKAICEDCINIYDNKPYCPVCYNILENKKKPTEHKKSPLIFLGSILLIFIGLFLLAYEFHYLTIFWTFFWPLILIIVGLYFLIDYYIFKTHNSAIPGISLGLLGIYLLSSYLDLIPYYLRGWPTYLGIIGIILLVYYFISQIKNYLFVSILFIVIGILLLLSNLNLFSFSVVVKLWPVIFIIIGIKLIYDFSTKRT